MALTYTDRNLKTVLHSWGRFKVTVLAAVQPGDLLSWYDTTNSSTVQLADESSGFLANCIACQEGAAGDEITAALKVELKPGTTLATGGGATPIYFAGADDFWGAPLYLGEDGKPESDVGTTTVQQVGVLLARDRILLDLQPTFGVDAKGVDWQVHGDLTNNSIKWDSKINRLTIQKTFTLAAQVGTYEYGQYIGMAFNVAAATGKYIAGLKIAFEGAAHYNSGTQLYGLWIDFQNVGTNSSAEVAHIILQVQSGACLPDCYIKLHVASPGVPHLFKFAHSLAPVSTFTAAGKHGTDTKKISIDIAGTEYFLLASTVPVAQ